MYNSFVYLGHVNEILSAREAYIFNAIYISNTPNVAVV